MIQKRCEEKTFDRKRHFLTPPISRAKGILSKLRHNAPIKICLQVYYAIFYSHLIYGCSLWGLTTKENLDIIEVLQNKCLRIITFSDFRSHSNPLFFEIVESKRNNPDSTVEISL